MMPSSILTTVLLALLAPGELKTFSPLLLHSPSNVKLKLPRPSVLPSSPFLSFDSIRPGIVSCKKQRITLDSRAITSSGPATWISPNPQTAIGQWCVGLRPLSSSSSSSPHSIHVSDLRISQSSDYQLPRTSLFQVLRRSNVRRLNPPLRFRSFRSNSRRPRNLRTCRSSRSMLPHRS